MTVRCPLLPFGQHRLLCDVKSCVADVNLCVVDVNFAWIAACDSRCYPLNHYASRWAVAADGVVVDADGGDAAAVAGDCDRSLRSLSDFD